MSFNQIANTITQHKLASAVALGAGLIAFGKLTYDYMKNNGWPLRPARPVVHSPEIQEIQQNRARLREELGIDSPK